MSVVLYTGERRSLALPVTSDVDPTATPPGFGFVVWDPDGPDYEPGSYVDGSWESETRAITPTIGGTAGDATIKLAPNIYVPWARLLVGSELLLFKLRRVQMVESDATP